MSYSAVCWGPHIKEDTLILLKNIYRWTAVSADLVSVVSVICGWLQHGTKFGKLKK